MKFNIFALIFFFAVIFTVNAHIHHKNGDYCDPKLPCPEGELCVSDEHGGWCVGQPCDAENPCPTGYECYVEAENGECQPIYVPPSPSAAT